MASITRLIMKLITHARLLRKTFVPLPRFQDLLLKHRYPHWSLRCARLKVCTSCEVCSSWGKHVCTVAPKRGTGGAGVMLTLVEQGFLRDFCSWLQCWKMCLYVAELNWSILTAGLVLSQTNLGFFHWRLYSWSWNVVLITFMGSGQVLLDLLLSWAN